MKASPLSIARSRVRREGGAVAIVLGLSIFVLFGFLALVIDLGRTYVVRTELQNAADAAALAGAKQLNQTAAGVCCGPSSAVEYAKAIAAQHKFNFGTQVSITNDNISVGKSPDGPWVAVAGISDADAADKTFLRVIIPSGDLLTFFAVVPTTAAGTGTSSLSTSGLAVAGWAQFEVTPIAVCAHKIATGESEKEFDVVPGGPGELKQFGFRRGVSNNIFALGPLGSPADTYLLNPKDKYITGAPGECNPSNSSATATAPFICDGSSIFIDATPGNKVYGNTGISAGIIEAALNSRFNDYSAPSVCIPAESKPDSNIKKYACNGGSCATPQPDSKVDWMEPVPTTQTIVGTTPPSADKYGVLWSYSRAVRAVGGNPPTGVGEEFTPTQDHWASLYPVPGASAPAPTGSFPSTKSPYLNDPHSSPPGKVNRRVLNLVIADCEDGKITGPAGCQTIPVLGVGRFFMQVPANFTGNPKKLEVEFAGLVQPVKATEIKLYR